MALYYAVYHRLSQVFMHIYEERVKSFDWRFKFVNNYTSDIHPLYGSAIHPVYV